MHKKITKTIALVLVLGQVLYSSGFPLRSLKAFSDNDPSPARAVSRVNMPLRMGTVDERWEGSTGITVFHIKDAHCNYYAQRTIYSIIDRLVRDAGVDLIALEGGSGPYDLGVLENIDNRDFKERLAYSYLRKGILTGAEMYRVFNPDAVELFGVESKDLYDKALKCYLSVKQSSGQLNAFLDKVQMVLETRSREIFSDTLARFLEDVSQFEKGEMELGSYLGMLFLLAESNGVDLGNSDHMRAMRDLLAGTEGMDFRMAQRERDTLLEQVPGRLCAYQRNALNTALGNTLLGVTAEIDIYLKLLEIARNADYPAEDTGFLRKYLEYLSAHRKIDQAGLIDEIKSAERDISSSLCATPEERILLGFTEKVRDLKRLFSLELSREEAIELMRDPGGISLIEYLSTDEKHMGFNKAVPVLLNSIATMSMFYRYADRRDEAFLNNMMREMGKRGKRSCVLVTGGFHSENLTKLMRKNGISYVSISPCFSEEEDYINPYLDLISGIYDVPDGASGIISIFSSAIQLRSVWNEMGVDADFIKAFMYRVAALVNSEIARGTKEFMLSLGPRRVFFSSKMSYRPTLVYPYGYDDRDDKIIHDCASMMGMPASECLERLSVFRDNLIRDSLVEETAVGSDVSETLREMLTRFPGETVAGEENNEFKRTYLRLPEGEVVRQDVRGMKNIDMFVYIFDVITGALMCQFSSANVMSGYMEEPSALRGRNEKAYLCSRVRQVYRPDIDDEQRLRILKELIREQKEYERSGQCGWEWIIDRDSDGNVVIDPELGMGLRGLMIFDRTKLPPEIMAQHLEDDAGRFGSEKSVQEMMFDIMPLGNGNVRIQLINSWSAEARIMRWQKTAYTDTLTGVHTRRYFDVMVAPGLRGDLPVSILFIDADHFKRFNDTYPGKHEFGDRVLKGIAGSIARSVRGTDTVIRWGGEEFVVILPGMDRRRGRVVARRILSNISKLRPEGLRPDDSVSATIGLASLENIPDAGAVDRVINSADEAMMEAKRQDRRGTVIFVGQEGDPPQDFGQAIGSVEIPSAEILGDLDELGQRYMPKMIEALSLYVREDKVRGMFQRGGIETIYKDIKDSVKRKIGRLRFYETVLKDPERSDAQKARAAHYAGSFLAGLNRYFKRVDSRIKLITGDSPASDNVSYAMLLIEHIRDLTGKYAAEHALRQQANSPFIGPDGKPLMWLDDKGKIHRNKASGPVSDRLSEWNEKHEYWHVELDSRYPDKSAASKEMAAIYLAFRDISDIGDADLEGLISNIAPDMFNTIPARRYEVFVRGISDYLQQTSREFFFGSDPERIEREARYILAKEDMDAASARVFRRGAGSSEESIHDMVTMMYIGMEYPEFTGMDDVDAICNFASIEGLSGEMYLMAAKFLNIISRKSPELLDEGVVRTIINIFKRQGLPYETYEFCVAASVGVSRNVPELIEAHFPFLPSVMRLMLFRDILAPEEIIDRSLPDGDKEVIALFCAYIVDRYFDLGTIPGWISEAAAIQNNRVDIDLPDNYEDMKALLMDIMERDPTGIEMVQKYLKLMYVNRLEGWSRAYSVMSVLQLNCVITPGEKRSRRKYVPLEESPTDSYIASMGMLLGAEKFFDESTGKPPGILFMPVYSNYLMQTLHMYIMRAYGVIPLNGSNTFTQMLGGLFPDEVKYVQIASLAVTNASYDWEKWNTGAAEGGIPPLGYTSDATYFPAGGIGEELSGMRPGQAVEHVKYITRARQLLVWALGASGIERRSLAGDRLASVWDNFKAGMDKILKENGLYDTLVRPEWVSREAMDGVEVNQAGYSVGSRARRQTIQEGLEMLEAKRSSDPGIRVEVFKLMEASADSVEEIIQGYAREYMARESIAGILTKVIKSSGIDEDILENAAREMSAIRESKPSEMITTVLESVEAMLERELAGGGGRSSMSENALLSLASTQKSIVQGYAQVQGINAEDPEALEQAMERSFSRMSFRMARFPGREKVVVYPVYSAFVEARDREMSADLRRRIARGDYGLNVTLMPYEYGNVRDLNEAVSRMRDIVGGSTEARAVVFANTAFFSENNTDLLKEFDGRVRCIKEEGGYSGKETFTYVSPYLRLALALSVIDYFNEESVLKGPSRDRVRDMISALLVIITGQENVGSVFRDDPSRLIRGVITLRPAEKISWEVVQEKVEASRRFMHSL